MYTKTTLDEEYWTEGYQLFRQGKFPLDIASALKGNLYKPIPEERLKIINETVRNCFRRMSQHQQECVLADFAFVSTEQTDSQAALHWKDNGHFIADTMESEDSDDSSDDDEGVVLSPSH